MCPLLECAAAFLVWTLVYLYVAFLMVWAPLPGPVAVVTVVDVDAVLVVLQVSYVLASLLSSL